LIIEEEEDTCHHTEKVNAGGRSIGYIFEYTFLIGLAVTVNCWLSRPQKVAQQRRTMDGVMYPIHRFPSATTSSRELFNYDAAV
jgi:hypothetical protein